MEHDDQGGVRDCVSDESYIPTLLAMHGLEAEAGCGSWGVAALDWGRGGAHPRTYQAGEVNEELFQKIREGQEGVREAQDSARRQLVDCHAAGAVADGASRAVPEPFLPMPGSPHLTARKFSAEVSAAALAVFSNCTSSLGMLSRCPL